MEPITRFIYLSTTGVHRLSHHLSERWPKIAKILTEVETSAETMRAVPSDGRIVIFTSNIFHRVEELGADGGLEENMTGAKMAEIIKTKNPKAEVYLYSERITTEPIFNGSFYKTKGSSLTEELEKFFKKIEKEIR